MLSKRFSNFLGNFAGIMSDNQKILIIKLHKTYRKSSINQ
jgi:hypothetical protein